MAIDGKICCAQAGGTCATCERRESVREALANEETANERLDDMARVIVNTMSGLVKMTDPDPFAPIIDGIAARVAYLIGDQR